MTNWRKSTRSFANGNCVEAANTGRRKSRRSLHNGNCLEASSVAGVMIRDTADRDGTVLTFPARTWAAFTAQLARQAG